MLWLVVGCTRDSDRGSPDDVLPTAETGTTLSPGQTATVSTGDTAPPSTLPSLIPMVRLFPEDVGDWAGRELDLADLEADGRPEILVASDWSRNSASGLTDDERSALYLLRAPIVPGDLANTAAAWWDGKGSVAGFGANPLLLPETGQIACSGRQSGIDTRFSVFDVPRQPPPGALSSQAYVAYIDDHLHNDYGVPSDAARCETPHGPALCLSGTNIIDLTDFSGHVLAYELPLVGAQPLLESTSWLKGDLADDARMLVGDDDLDGDGRADLVVGAYGWGGDAGRLAVLHELPSGEHRLWDVASATLTGEAAGEQLGLALATGDLDGDGYSDVLAGAPLGDGGAFVFFGPFAGDRTASQADVTISGGMAGQWLGYALATGDLTADGGADLAIGAPWSIYIEDAPPGEVLIYDDPLGTLDISDAIWRIASGVSAPDAFGIAIGQGDLDGDGYGDLVIGAPRDPTVARDAGSVSILSGTAL
jgi:hypothetical protein